MADIQSKTSIGSTDSSIKPTWIELNINRVECTAFVPSKKDPYRCGCGRFYQQHEHLDLSKPKKLFVNQRKPIRWDQQKHTKRMPTNAFGVVEFQGGPHPIKARFLRLDSTTLPQDVLHVLFHEWNLRIPNLVITVLGGLADFDLQPKLKRVFRVGLVKAATTTGAWVFSHGLDTGVSKHVGDAMNENLTYDQNVVTLGFAPWGVVQHRNHLIGNDIIRPYYSISSLSKKEAVLNKGHTHFLLCDNGTSEKFGCELQLRRRFEQFMGQQFIDMRKHGGTKSRVPIVAVLLEGGPHSFATVLQLITDEMPVPVVVCDGSGRAADLLSFAHKYADDKGKMPADVRSQLVTVMMRTFKVKREVANELYREMELCLRHKDLISIFRFGDDANADIDIAILTALLHASCDKLTPSGQLSLTMAWNRVDIARTKVFKFDRIWKPSVLENAMFDALINDRLEFVKLLLENGVSMSTFLTEARLELLYSTTEVTANAGFHKLLYDLLSTKEKFSLRLVGLFIERFMGSGYAHPYCQKAHKQTLSPAGSVLRSLHGANPSHATGSGVARYRYPYTELMQWALLTRRYALARYMMFCGEECIAKSLMAMKLCKGIRKGLVKDLSVEYYHELLEWEKEFESDAVALQDFCYTMDKTQAMRLLTYELKAFSKHTCLSLAYLCESKAFLSHSCTQSILSDLWYGGLQQCRLIDCRVVLALLLTCTIVCLPLLAYLVHKHRLLQFKTKRQLLDQPQTLEEYLAEMYDSSSSSSSSSSESATTHSRQGSLRARHQRVRQRSIPPQRDSHSDRVALMPTTKDVKASMSVVESSSSKKKTGESVIIAIEEIDKAKNPPSKSHLSTRHSCPDLIPQEFDADGVFQEDDVHAGNYENDSLFQNLSMPFTDDMQIYSNLTDHENNILPETIVANLTRKRSKHGKKYSKTKQHHHHHEQFDEDKTTARAAATTTTTTDQQQSKSNQKHANLISPRVKFSSNKNGDKLSRVQTSNIISNCRYSEASRRLSFHTSSTTPLFSTLMGPQTAVPGVPSTINGTIRPINCHDNLPPLPCSLQQSQQEQLGVRKKIYEFFNAPITRYHLHFIFYLIFLGCFIYTSSVYYEPHIFLWVDIFVHTYVYVYFVDKFRELYIGAGSTTARKLKVHFFHFWNVYDHVVCLLSICVMIFRYITFHHPEYYNGTRAAWSFCCSLWVLRMLELMQIWMSMGTTIYMTKEMVKQMLPLLVLLFLSVMSFGIIRQGIMESYNNREFTIETLKEILMKPYFMLYGEVYAGEIDPKDWPYLPFNNTNMNSTFSFLAPLSMVVFLILSCFLIISVLIARFNEIYSYVRQQSELVYKYLRYSCIMEYESMPLIPPPLTIISWFYSIFKLIRRWRKFHEEARSIGGSSTGLKLFLSQEEIEVLHDFEEECVQRYCHSKEKVKEDKMETLLNMSECMSSMSERLDDIHQRQYLWKLNLVNDMGQLETNVENKIHQVFSKLSSIDSFNQNNSNQLIKMSGTIRGLKLIHQDLHQHLLSVDKSSPTKCRLKKLTKKGKIGNSSFHQNNLEEDLNAVVVVDEAVGYNNDNVDDDDDDEEEDWPSDSSDSLPPTIAILRKKNSRKTIGEGRSSSGGGGGSGGTMRKNTLTPSHQYLTHGWRSPRLSRTANSDLMEEIIPEENVVRRRGFSQKQGGGGRRQSRDDQFDSPSTPFSSAAAPPFSVVVDNNFMPTAATAAATTTTTSASGNRRRTSTVGGVAVTPRMSKRKLRQRQFSQGTTNSSSGDVWNSHLLSVPSMLGGLVGLGRGTGMSANPHGNYTTICDDIDITALRQVPSSSTSRSGSLILGSDAEDQDQEERKQELLNAEQCEREQLGDFVLTRIRRQSIGTPAHYHVSPASKMMLPPLDSTTVLSSSLPQLSSFCRPPTTTAKGGGGPRFGGYDGECGTVGGLVGNVRGGGGGGGMTITKPHVSLEEGRQLNETNSDFPERFLLPQAHFHISSGDYSHVDDDDDDDEEEEDDDDVDNRQRGRNQHDCSHC